MDRNSPRGLLFVSVIICLGYLGVGLYPFNFFQRNQVSWDPGGGGISFGRYGIVYGRKEIELGKNGGISVELLLRAGPQPRRGTGSILSLYDSETERLSIRRRGAYLLLSVFTRDAGRQPRWGDLKNALPAGSRRFLSVTSGPAGTAAYIDGAPIRTWTRLAPDAAGLRWRLVLGGDPEGSHSWRGELSGAAVFDRVLDASEIARHRALTSAGGLRALSSEPDLSALYIFDRKSGSMVEDSSPSHVPLVIPEHYTILRPTYLEPIWRDSLHTTDVVINIAGFVPLGFFYLLYKLGRRPVLRSILATVALAAAVSATIELLQAYLPSRSSSMSDLIFNTAGALLGILLALAYRRLSPSILPMLTR